MSLARGAAPRPILTSDEGSFAARTLAVRVPKILEDTVARNRFEGDARARCEALLAELREGALRALVEDAPDRAAWDEAAAPHVGESWLALPWYFAEAFFYRRLLEATGYFQPGPLRGIDPFLPMKRDEERPDGAPRLVERALASLPAERAARTRALLLAALWGNRADLSLDVAKGLAGRAHAQSDLIVDDSAAVVDLLAAGAPSVIVVADNAGTELGMDLALVDLLLARGSTSVRLALKAHPFFVSDATPADLSRLLDVFEEHGGAETRSLAERLRGRIDEGRLVVEAHPFFTSSAFYSALPGDLRAAFRAADLVVVKGDANYRRLCGDARWPPTTPFADVVREVPGRLVALRTCKAELQVGLSPGQAEALDEEEPGWRVNGRRGVVQARL